MPEYGKVETVDFATAWKHYVNDLQNSGKRLLISLFEKVSPDFNGTDAFSLKVPNNVVADRLEDERQEMMVFLRKQTGNNKLTMQVEVEQTETEITPYTNREKFDSMAQKNPKLLDLKNALDLEIE